MRVSQDIPKLGFVHTWIQSHKTHRVQTESKKSNMSKPNWVVYVQYDWCDFLRCFGLSIASTYHWFTFSPPNFHNPQFYSTMLLFTNIFTNFIQSKLNFDPKHIEWQHFNAHKNRIELRKILITVIKSYIQWDFKMRKIKKNVCPQNTNFGRKFFYCFFLICKSF